MESSVMGFSEHHYKVMVSILLATSLLGASAAFVAADSCSNATITLWPNYKWAVGSVQLQGQGSDPEPGCGYRWLVDGQEVEEGFVEELFHLAANGSLTAAGGESPASSSQVSFISGRWGMAIRLGSGGSLSYYRDGNIGLAEGAIEMWVAPQRYGWDHVYSDYSHVLFKYVAGNGDWIAILQAWDTGVIYAGGVVGGDWESAYSSSASTRSWLAREWHHVVFTYSASGNFMRFYLDGVLMADTNEGFYHPPEATGSVFWIGCDPDSNVSLYDIDEVHIWRRPLSADEIKARARRRDEPRPHECWSSLEGVGDDSQLTFEVTPNGGDTCSSEITYPGIPIMAVSPPSTLLPAGSTSVQLHVSTVDAAECRWSLGEPLEFNEMTPFTTGAGTTEHDTTITGLDTDPNRVNEVYVRCSSQPDYLEHLRYRVLSQVFPRFPRKGNLWGSWEYVANGGLQHCARIDLWLGAHFSPNEIRELRRLNPGIRILTSINAVDREGLPDDYYLKDVSGNKIEIWPGYYRLNMTKMYVAEAQARYAAQRILDSDLMFDGCFFDNVFTTQSWLKFDIHGNPVHIDADEDGVEDDPEELDAAWRAGVFHELELFRQLMPWAIMSGHAMDITEEGIGEIFNGISVGFETANVIEGEESFSQLWDMLQGWQSDAREPRATMIESSPIDLIAYGYDYAPWDKIPDETLSFAKNYGPWMRFGLAVTLMTDGYFAHEFGDTWHGNDWWYDELDFDLGYPLGPPQMVDIGVPPGPEMITNGSFEDPLDPPWGFWVDVDQGVDATVTRDTSTAADGSTSVKIDITVSGEYWQVELDHDPLSVEQGKQYELIFWAKADHERQILVDFQKDSPDWDDYGLWRRVTLGTEWQQYVLHFEATATASDGELQFLVGEDTGSVWIDGVSMRKMPPQVWRRDFTHGSAILNATNEVVLVPLEDGFWRLEGDLSPRWEPIVDDEDPEFFAQGGWSEVTLDSGEWQDSGPFYHDWGEGCHLSDGGEAVAEWELPVDEVDGWTVMVWWPAAPDHGSWSPAAHYEIIANGDVLVSQTLDQSAQGDRWVEVGHSVFGPDDSPILRLTCPGGDICCADAVLLRSDGRFNDGSAVSGHVRLGPMDGIVLRWESPAGPADVDRNLVVDGADMVEILRAIYGEFTPLDVDVNDDGAVDSADLAFVIDSYSP